jgi:transposase
MQWVKLPEAEKSFVLLPCHWVVERSFGWATRARRLAGDHERYAGTLAGLHLVAASVCVMLRQAARPAAGA